MQNAAEMLLEGAKALRDGATDDEVTQAARDVIIRHKERRQQVFGVGHPIHVDGDPRVPALRDLSRENGYYGLHWRLMEAISAVLINEHKRKLPMNVVGAIGAIIAAMGLDPLIGRGLALVGRSAGLLAHVLEEKSQPMAREAWELVLQADPRNVLP